MTPPIRFGNLQAVMQNLVQSAYNANLASLHTPGKYPTATERDAQRRDAFYMRSQGALDASLQSAFRDPDSAIFVKHPELFVDTKVKFKTGSSHGDADVIDISLKEMLEQPDKVFSARTAPLINLKEAKTNFVDTFRRVATNTETPGILRTHPAYYAQQGEVYGSSTHMQYKKPEPGSVGNIYQALNHVDDSY